MHKKSSSLRHACLSCKAKNTCISPQNLLLWVKFNRLFNINYSHLSQNVFFKLSVNERLYGCYEIKINKTKRGSSLDDTMPFFTQNWKGFKEIYFKMHFLLCSLRENERLMTIPNIFVNFVRGTHSPWWAIEWL